ncbi:TonB family protein [Geothrix alkalitolerans]|uniref:TonB family protein n=1 Tax=Geothrix alkalitolerans TaxID=2922724 RepID=UPI001FAFC2EC|nr:TonB family protein [Geothrix alkalitolerans]
MFSAHRVALSIVVSATPAFSQTAKFNSISPSAEELKAYTDISNEMWAKMGKPTPPPYPTLSKMAGFSGPVEVLLEVDTSGKVTKANSLKSTAYHPSLAPTAISWSSTLKFPPTESTEPIARKFRIFVVFSKPGNVEIRPSLDTQFN